MRAFPHRSWQRSKAPSPQHLAAQATQQQIGAQAGGSCPARGSYSRCADPTLALENYYRKLKSELEGSIPKLPGAAQGGIYRAWAITIQTPLREGRAC